MPIFFNKSELTAEQEARWDYAITEYQRVQDANIDFTMKNLTDADRASYSNRDSKCRFLNDLKVVCESGRE